MAPPTGCSQCTEVEAKYTCPRCAVKTCSLGCSRQHKEKTGCSGERNKAAYVPMKEYGWGTLMDDYTFLESVGRQTEEWGRQIVQSGILANQRGQAPARGRGRGRGRGGIVSAAFRSNASRADKKRGYFKAMLAVREVDVELLPSGMARRKLNQSSWDSKQQCALLTVELVFHPPQNTLALVTQPPDPVTILSHRQDWSLSVADIITRCLSTKQNASLSDWITELASGQADGQTVSLLRVVDGDDADRRGFRQLDATIPLQKALKGANFVEFPTLHIWDIDALAEAPPDRLAAESTVAELEVGDEDRPTKRRKVDATARIQTLLGDYASDSDEDEEGEEVEAEEEFGSSDAEGSIEDKS